MFQTQGLTGRKSQKVTWVQRRNRGSYNLSPPVPLFLCLSLSLSLSLCISVSPHLSVTHREEPTQGQPATKEEPTSPQSQASEGRMWFLGISCFDPHWRPCMGGSPAQERSCTLTVASPGFPPPFTRGAPTPSPLPPPWRRLPDVRGQERVRAPEWLKLLSRDASVSIRSRTPMWRGSWSLFTDEETEVLFAMVRNIWTQSWLALILGVKGLPDQLPDRGLGEERNRGEGGPSQQWWSGLGPLLQRSIRPAPLPVPPPAWPAWLWVAHSVFPLVPPGWAGIRHQPSPAPLSPLCCWSAGFTLYREPSFSEIYPPSRDMEGAT